MKNDSNILLKNVIKNKILNDINISIIKGQTVAIMGYSGSGKTTLLNLMSGLDTPDSGTIIINGTTINLIKEPRLTEFRSKNISYIFQDYKLIEYLSINENITLIQDINKIKINKNKFDNICKKLNITNLLDKKVSQLSGGQKQRVAIARALIGDNDFIFADEPTGALDMMTRDVIIKELIENSKVFNKTLVVVTHDPMVAKWMEKVIFIDDHKIESINERMNVNDIELKMESLFKNV
ncbi:ABC transporter ATP-binding protein [Spiroplasma cantharicola]|uniref:ABC transporter ATP-binding protein n=1 Tax=Spiroplasma cantharicola TaxID=362837 RepID=A0A0M4JS62_9MOLU|nr:ABC transporter ATP-binding protein [Spiroplasma cantharicola]ALD66335.1 ABC transporter ATP-binding protein [Spiroplasma cantharicola]